MAERDRGRLPAILVFYIGYQVVFEVAGGGRTPGKRASGLRVVTESGGSVGLRASLIRNLMRLIEGLPLSYLPAMISVAATRNNQRLGDLAPRAPSSSASRKRPRRGRRRAATAEPPGRALCELGRHGRRRGRVDRRARVPGPARRTWTRERGRALAAQLAGHLRPLVAGVRPGLTDETFLEHLAAAKSRGMMQRQARTLNRRGLKQRGEHTQMSQSYESAPQAPPGPSAGRAERPARELRSAPRRASSSTASSSPSRAASSSYFILAAISGRLGHPGLRALDRRLLRVLHPTSRAATDRGKQWGKKALNIRVIDAADGRPGRLRQGVPAATWSGPSAERHPRVPRLPVDVLGCPGEAVAGTTRSRARSSFPSTSTGRAPSYPDGGSVRPKH